MTELKTYVGAIHIHTKCSDGSGDLEEIIAAGKAAKLDYLLITDHNKLTYYELGKEGWYGSLMVMVGEEITHKKGHCLALNIKRTAAKNNGNPQVYLRDIAAQGGLSFIAHPHLADKPLFKVKRCTWQNWHLDQFHGIEIWSFMTDWIRHLNLRNFITRCRKPEQFIGGPLKATLRKWDELCQRRQVVAIGGVDAHAKVLAPFGLIKIFPYKMLFNTIRTYVISPPLPQRNFAEARKLFYKALVHGHCYVVNAYLHDARNFSFYAISPEGKILLQGDAANFVDDYQLVVKLPVTAQLRLIHNGKLLLAQHTREFYFAPVSAGVYRIEVYLNGQPWIFSNPIYLREKLQVSAHTN